MHSTSTNNMQLGAYIDNQTGAMYVGNLNNTEWLYADLPVDYTRVLNEDGGESVTIEDIDFALANQPNAHKSIFYDNKQTADFCQEQ